MIRMAFSLLVCGIVFAAMPARAQGEATDSPPANGFAAQPAPAPNASPENAPPAPAQESKPPESPIVENKPAESPAAAGKPPESPVVESKPPETPVVESEPAERPAENPIAESKPPENGEARYTFSRVQSGYVRLDNRTGQVSFCSKRTVGWTCQLAPEDRGVFENEIARLQEENAALKKDLLRRGLPLPGAMKPDAAVARSERPVALPTDPNFDRMKDFVGEVWRRLVALIVTLQKDVLNKG